MTAGYSTEPQPRDPTFIDNFRRLARLVLRDGATDASLDISGVATRRSGDQATRGLIQLFHRGLHYYLHSCRTVGGEAPSYGMLQVPVAGPQASMYIDYNRLDLPPIAIWPRWSDPRERLGSHALRIWRIQDQATNDAHRLVTAAGFDPNATAAVASPLPPEAVAERQLVAVRFNIGTTAGITA